MEITYKSTVHRFDFKFNIDMAGKPVESMSRVKDVYHTYALDTAKLEVYGQGDDDPDAYTSCDIKAHKVLSGNKGVAKKPERLFVNSMLLVHSELLMQAGFPNLAKREFDASWGSALRHAKEMGMSNAQADLYVAKKMEEAKGLLGSEFKFGATE